MSRIRNVAALTVVAVLAFAGVALAAPVKITGGTTQVSVSPAVATALAANHITTTALAPATAVGSTFSFPIAGGRIKAKNLHGVIRHRGGLAISNGTRTARLRRLTLVSNRHGVSLFAIVRSGLKTAVRRVARVTDITVTGPTATTAASATGIAQLTRFSARAINRLAGKRIASAGMAFGTVTISPKFG